MCGIAGVITWSGNKVAPERLALLTNSLSNRGPDGSGTWISKNGCVGLGHTRLSILDLSEHAKQPMANNLTGHDWITYNGEIYNFLEARRQLTSEGLSFFTESDTEVLLKGISAHGTSMLDRLNGMWAFGHYNARQEKLVLARDRFGVKPIYYYKSENEFVFASEVQAIHKYLGRSHPLDQEVMNKISLGALTPHGTDKTYLQGVRAVPAGSFLELMNGKISIHKWYHLKKVETPNKYPNQVQHFKDLLIDATKLRLRSDVKVGTCLSGGLDSSSLTSLIFSKLIEPEKRFSQSEYRAFCAGFAGTFIDEQEKAKRLCKTLGAPLDVVEVYPPSPEELQKAMDLCDGPMHALAFYPIWKLYRHIASSGVKVTLDGQGPDEMLGGYRPLAAALKTAALQRKPFWYQDVLRTYAAQGESSQFSSRRFALATLKQSFKNDLRLFKNGAQQRLLPLPNAPDFIRLPIDQELHQQFFLEPLPGILQQYDRCSMASGVECRMPFMDYRLVEYVFSLPPQAKIGGGYTKRILRDAVKGIVPNEIRKDRIKIGFNAPIVDWFRGPLKEWMLDQMNSQEFSQSPYFDGKRISENFQNFTHSKTPKWQEAWQFWGPVHLTWWQKNIRDKMANSP